MLVLLHPIGLQGSWWAPYVAELQDAFTVVTVDLAGHGASPLEGDAITLEDHARAVEGLIVSMGASAHVVGASMGGMVAQTLAILAPSRVASLGLVSTMATVPDALRPAIAQRGQRALEEGMESSIDQTVERWVLPGQSASRFADRCRSQLSRVSPRSWCANWQAISQLRTLESLDRVTCPSLVCTGEQDVSTTPVMARAMAQALPSSEFHLLDGVAHMGVFERPELFLPLLRSFLRPLAA